MSNNVRLTKRQEDALKALVENVHMDQEQRTRYIMEGFVEQGLAFRNEGTKKIQTKGRIRRSATRLIRHIFYTATPDAHRLLEQLENQESSVDEKEAPTRKYRTRVVEATPSLGS